MAANNDLIFLQSPPFYFRVAKEMYRRQIKGGGFLLRTIRRIGLLDRMVIKYTLNKGYDVFVPIYRPEQWDLKDIIGYEADLVQLIVDACGKYQGLFTILDCGADIGIISVLVASKLSSTRNIIAFEPSDEAFPVLEKSLASLSIEARAIKTAVSDFTGEGKLMSPSYDASHHARYLAQIEGGGFPVTTIDALNLQIENLLIKIDVEGGEMGVAKGAKNTIGIARNAVITVEAHPKVFSRTGIDPILILRELASIRSFGFEVAEARNKKLDLSIPFFKQYKDDGTIYNIVCYSN
jgi:FkbM family methyltransferase